jgi:hypothetical protein
MSAHHKATTVMQMRNALIPRVHLVVCVRKVGKTYLVPFPELTVPTLMNVPIWINVAKMVPAKTQLVVTLVAAPNSINPKLTLTATSRALTKMNAMVTVHTSVTIPTILIVVHVPTRIPNIHASAILVT